MRGVAHLKDNCVERTSRLPWDILKCFQDPGKEKGEWPVSQKEDIVVCELSEESISRRKGKTLSNSVDENGDLTTGFRNVEGKHDFDKSAFSGAEVTKY